MLLGVWGTSSGDFFAVGVNEVMEVHTSSQRKCKERDGQSFTGLEKPSNIAVKITQQYAQCYRDQNSKKSNDGKVRSG